MVSDFVFGGLSTFWLGLLRRFVVWCWWLVRVCLVSWFGWLLVVGFLWVNVVGLGLLGFRVLWVLWYVGLGLLACGFGLPGWLWVSGVCLASSFSCGVGII